MAKLTPKQRRFCQEYLIDFNGSAAAIRAGYSKKTAAIIASENLTKPNIQAELNKLRGKAEKRTEITSDRVLEELAHVAFSRITNHLKFDEEGIQFKSSDDLDDSVIAAIESVTYIKNSTVTEKGESESIRQTSKVHNKMQALTLLAKYFGIDSDFEQARSTLRKYGLALLTDESSPLGWRLERHVAS